MAKSFAEQMSRLAKSDAVKVLPKEPKGLASGTPAKPKTLSLFWNNKLHTIVPSEVRHSDNPEKVIIMYNLNDLFKISGYTATKRPSIWTANEQTIELSEKFLSSGIPALRIVRGRGDRGAGTWVIEELLYAYASWLSAEFHKAVLDAFAAAVAGNMVKVREIVRSAVRQEGVPIRKEFASTFMSTDARSEAIEFATDQINLAVTGKTAEGIKALIHLIPLIST